MQRSCEINIRGSTYTQNVLIVLEIIHTGYNEQLGSVISGEQDVLLTAWNWS